MSFAELLGTVLVAFGLVGWVAYIVSIYTEMVRLMGRVTRSQRRIGLLRCRLVDEVPKLIKICEADLGEDAACLTRLRASRSEFEMAGDASGRDEAALRLSDALVGVFGIVEARPQLHVRASFERLYHRVTDLQGQIDECEALHDETAAVFNARIEGWVERRVADWLQLGPIEPLGARHMSTSDEASEWAIPA